jgi:hypothetical protein
MILEQGDCLLAVEHPTSKKCVEVPFNLFLSFSFTLSQQATKVIVVLVGLGLKKEDRKLPFSLGLPARGRAASKGKCTN